MRTLAFTLLCLFSVYCGISLAADVVPDAIKQPGTQPGEVGNLESPDKCDNCHGGYDTAVEPAHNWRGSMMANAGRDPIFWATLAIAEQDFDGAGDLCIRCHGTSGWLAGRSTPTDGSGLANGDADGVECDFCHKLTNPDDSEHLGEQYAPFVANDGGNPAEGYYGSGMSSLWGGSEKLGPYSSTAARHQDMQSLFHRSADFCGTCHDVSNAITGDVAHNNGTQDTADPVTASGSLSSPVDQKAAFNNFPYQYGIVERTFSEYKSGLLHQTPVSAYPNLPADLQDGAIMTAYQSSLLTGTLDDYNYEDGTVRYFTCQTCHMRPVDGPGCNKNGAPVRKDLPLHDMTGGNYWMPEAIQYLDAQGKLRLGGGLTATQIAAMNDGITRARQQLDEAAALEVNGDILKIINLTGHKLITGYPEGRRMWLNIKWYDATEALLREDGEYGTLLVDLDGDGQVNDQVETILDPYDPDTIIYEAHYGMTQEWAVQLIGLGKPGGLVLSYDPVTGDIDYTLADLAAQDPGTYHETFHFVLNNKITKDNRIPPYGMDCEEARKRNALPVPNDQYGGDQFTWNPDGTCSGTYNYWDSVTLNPPPGAVRADITLYYQPTSWEYIQFLYLANNKSNAFLANEGDYMLEAWLNTGMATPHAMATATWVTTGCPNGPARTGGTDYSSLQTAYNAAGPGQTIMSQNVSFTEPLNINLEKDVALIGGYDCYYTTVEGMTTLNGTVTITQGSITIENLVVQ